MIPLDGHFDPPHSCCCVTWLCNGETPFVASDYQLVAKIPLLALYVKLVKAGRS